MAETGGVTPDRGLVIANDILLWGATGLGTLSLVLAGLAVYLIARRQGYFYRVSVRSTHRTESDAREV